MADDIGKSHMMLKSSPVLLATEGHIAWPIYSRGIARFTISLTIDISIKLRKVKHFKHKEKKNTTKQNNFFSLK